MQNYDALQTSKWMQTVGLGSFSKTMLESNITGDILCYASHETLKDIGMQAVGQRIMLLKAVYFAKVAEGIPFEDGDYIPESSLPLTQPC